MKIKGGWLNVPDARCHTNRSLWNWDFLPMPSIRSNIVPGELGELQGSCHFDQLSFDQNFIQSGECPLIVRTVAGNEQVKVAVLTGLTPCQRASHVDARFAFNKLVRLRQVFLKGCQARFSAFASAGEKSHFYYCPTRTS